MTAASISDLLSGQPVFQELDRRDLDLFAGCARNQVFPTGAYLAREGDPADALYVVRRGRIGIELHAPGGPLLVETLGDGEVEGWSWIFPPHRWAYDVEALEPVHAVVIDGSCLRRKCDDDPAFGYRVMQRFAQVVAQRLYATRVRLLDLYGAPR